MSTFTEFEDFEPVEGTRKMYKLTADLMWEIGSKGSGWQVIVPKGTPFDISVPKLLEWAQSPHDRAVLLAAAVHDELLNLGHDVGFASAEFRRAALARKQTKIWAWVLFLATLIWTAMGEHNRRQERFAPYETPQ